MKIDLQSVVETHDKPFVIIDETHRIKAANSSYLKTFATTLPAVLGELCHHVIHGKETPCHELGEECPFQRIRETDEPYSCLHVHRHYDGGNNARYVQIKGFPLRLDDGRVYLGESIVELAAQHRKCDQERCMMGSSRPFFAALEAMKRAAATDAPVLIQGETGTGKELAASFVHHHSSRSRGPFLTLDCTVLSDNLVESEFFGHERGAFTGSVGERQGLFKLADGGTLFLDEIGDLPPQLQAKLLRVLESGEFRRVGGNRTIKSDVRIVCATNRDLSREVDLGNFREDLYYRLACLSIQLPSLRERKSDIPELAEHLLLRIQRPGEPRLRLSDRALKLLEEYEFPGNVRELKNILQAAAVHAQGTWIRENVIKNVIKPRTSPHLRRRSGADPGEERTTKHRRNPLLSPESEKSQLRELLHANGGNRAAVARALGVTERTVYRKIKLYGLN